MKIKPTGLVFYVSATILSALILMLVAYTCSSEVHGQNRGKTVVISDFDGGLNTQSDPHDLAPNEFIQFMNLEFTERGGVRNRKGIKNVTDSLDRHVALNDTVLHRGNIFFKRSGVIFDILYLHFDTTLPSGDTSLPLFPSGWWDGDSIFNIDSTKSSFIEEYTVFFEDSTRALVVVPAGTGFAVNDSFFLQTEDSVGFIVHTDTGDISGVYGYYDRQGRKFLMTVSPGFGSNDQWSDIRISRQGEYEQQIKLSDNIHEGETPDWATWRGAVFMAFDRQPPHVWTGSHFMRVQPRAPGELNVFPIANGNLNGFYRWAIRTRRIVGSGDTASSRLSYITPQLQLRNENARLYGFWREAQDSITTIDSTLDSMWVDLYRTKGRPLATISVQDTFFYDTTFILTSQFTIDTMRYTDSISDASLNTDSTIFVYPLDSVAVENATKMNSLDDHHIDSIFHFSSWGAPRFMSIDSSGGGGEWILSAPTTERDSNWIATRYFYLIIDTILGARSDSSINLIISHRNPYDGTGTDTARIKSIGLGIPQLGIGDTGLIRVVYRSQGYIATASEVDIVITDTFLSGNTILPPDHPFLQLLDSLRSLYPDLSILTQPISVMGVRVATITRILYSERKEELRWTGFFPIRVLADRTKDTIVDTLDWNEAFRIQDILEDTTSSGGIKRTVALVSTVWEPLLPLGVIKGFDIADDRLYAFKGSRLFLSALDTPGVFHVFSSVAFNLDDGQVIIAVKKYGPNLIVFKNDSYYEFYDPINGLPTKSSAVNGIGCVAQQSIIEDEGLLYFLSSDGIRALGRTQFKEYGADAPIVSWNINNTLLGTGTTKRTASQLSKCSGIRIGGPIVRLMWSFPGTDTTFVFTPSANKGRGAWALRSHDFTQATYYDTSSAIGVKRTSQEVVFIKGGERIYIFDAISAGAYDLIDTSEGDSNSVRIILESRPIFGLPGERMTWKIDRIAWIADPSVTSGLRAFGTAYHRADVSILDKDGATITTTDFVYPEDDYINLGFAPHRSNWLSFKIHAGDSSWENIILRSIEITGFPMGQPRRN